MENQEWKVIITSGPLSEEYMEAEIYSGDELWAIITEDGNTVEFYPRLTDQPWRFSVDEVQDLLKFAKEELLKRNDLE